MSILDDISKAIDKLNNQVLDTIYDYDYYTFAKDIVDTLKKEFPDISIYLLPEKYKTNEYEKKIYVIPKTNNPIKITYPSGVGCLDNVDIVVNGTKYELKGE